VVDAIPTRSSSPSSSARITPCSPTAARSRRCGS
jgi:hypothetical protein